MSDNNMRKNCMPDELICPLIGLPVDGKFANLNDLNKALYCHREFGFISNAMCGTCHKEFDIPKCFGKKEASQVNQLTEQFLSSSFIYTKDYIKGKLVEGNDIPNQINLPTLQMYVDFAYVFFIKANVQVWNQHKILFLKNTYRKCSEYIDNGFKTFDTLLELLYVPKGASDRYAEIIYASIDKLIHNVSMRKLVDIHYDFEK